MATIALYANNVNQLPDLIKNVKNSVSNYKEELSNLKKKTLTVNKSVCDLEDVIESIQSSTKTQEEKINFLGTLKVKSEEFISNTITKDLNAADAVNQQKDDFYEKYYYLKPECEKSKWEKIKDGFKKFGKWCKEHWKIIVTVALVIAAVVIIVCTAGAALGPISTVLLMVAKGILVGTTIGGLVGGTYSAVTGGSFFEGFENGAFSGAISGALAGGIGSWLQLGSNVGLSLGKDIFLGSFGDTVASLMGDFGDIVIKGEQISFGEVMFNAGFSAVLGGLFGAAGHGLGAINKIKIKIPGINKGNGSWAHAWATQSARSLRNGTKVSLKTILKGIGSKTLDDVWSFCLEPFKNFADKKEKVWNLITE